MNKIQLIKNYKELNYRNVKDMRKVFIKRKIYYYGYTNDVKYIISICPVCIQNNKNFNKRVAPKTINFDNTKDNIYSLCNRIILKF